MTPEKLAQAFKPLYSYQLPAWWQTKQGALILIVGGILAIGMLCFLAWYRWWYRPPLTLTQWRDRELESLAEMLTHDHVNYKRFFGATTFFLKQYLLRLYGWQVLDKTDDELLAIVATKEEVPESLVPRIHELLSYAQMVKFADQVALAEKADEALRTVRTIVGRLQVSKKH